MKARQLLMAVLAIPAMACAADLEASIGRTGSTGNSWSIGANGQISQDLRWRAGYADLGMIEVASSPCSACLGGGAAPAADTNAKGVYLAAVKTWPLEDTWTANVEAGLWRYRSQAGDATAYGTGPLLGVGIGRGQFSLALTWYATRPDAFDRSPPTALNLSLRANF